ncbi:mechanosensitive ion channel family protein [Alteromonas aestuariivivens]|uniref:Small-conductance mechanosensitive channel n=2 Tax=Alteromonas aestuariivivens TaxID=1938339 RepID=A0A3D8MC15_9ALTE|nr:mechanosensitive ion channel family protein [Alteromonas aestuariivivens]
MGDLLNDFGLSLWQQLPGIALGLLLLLLTLFLANPLSSWVVSPFFRSSQNALMRLVTRRTIAVLIVLMGCYLFLKLAGLTEFAVAVVSGTGILGIILGFAFRDIAENFVSSLLLTVQRPFKLNDVVQINQHMGIVQKVTTRATTLVDFDGNHIQIPNASIYKGVIKNFTANPKMRGQFVIGVGYDNDIAVAQQLAVDLLASRPQVLDDPAPQVLIDSLGSATVNIKVYYWINVEQTSVVKMSSVLMRELVALYTRQGISMPDDAREIIFPQGIPVIHQSEDKAGPAAKPEAPAQWARTAPEEVTTQSQLNEDVSSDNETIRQQAAKSRDPEAGGNIL